ncbi:MAG TPA: signal peptidase I [Dehalococcoidia bacterium]|nr:signal peptidase I [Dehalococcoidia bacterium]
MTKDPAEGRFVLRRGMRQHDWRAEAPPPPPIPARSPLPGVRVPAIPRPGLPALTTSPIIAGSIAVTAVLVLAALFLVLSFHSYKAQGQSMEPRLHDGDRLLVGRIVYQEVDFGLFGWLPLYDSSDLRWGNPAHGDVVVFHSPVRKEQLVKRVIGVPGDVVRIDKGRVYVNGSAIAEPYARGESHCLQACGDVIVPEDHYFVLGDNRESSVDSRQGWTILRDDITGKVLFSY